MATILVVDDNPTNREYLVTLLGYEGHQMLEASNGLEALERVRDERPDLVIIDVLMPKMDGFEFLRQLRTDVSIAQTRVVMYTATYLEAEARRLAEAGGVIDLLIKPIEPQTVLNVVRAALAKPVSAASPVLSEGFRQKHMRLLTAKLVEKLAELEALNRDLERRVADRTAELEKQRQRMQAILDAAGDGIVITNPDWTIEYVNAAQERITGYSLAEVAGQTTDIWKSDLTPDAVYQDMGQTLARGETWQGDVVNRRKDGHVYDIASTVTPLVDAGGRPVAYVGVHHDISRLKELDRLKSKFVSDVSHELRTPVTNLKLYADLLTDGSPAKHTHYLSVLKEQAERLAYLVESILDLSRLELAEKKSAFGAVSLNGLIESVVVAHLPSAGAKGLQLTFTPDAALPAVRGETNQLAQLVTNLVTNAIHYTPAGGVYVSTHFDAAHGEARLEVQDTGLGIDPEDLPHLFERFYRGRNANRSGVPGTGLGLGIVMEIVKLHAGRIEVTSAVNAGTTFRVWLPLAER